MPHIFGVYKPVGPTSNDVLTDIKRITHLSKVGHAGTLDPLASGVLVVGIGREATRQLGEVVQKEKEYIATIRLGVSSTTDDEEGEKTEHDIAEIPSQEQIHEVLKKFMGAITQIPPVYSAIKVSGKEAYKRVRSGETIVMKARPALVYSIELIEYVWPVLTLRVVTGPGVYIRALARDIGAALAQGGYLAALERTRVGQFTKENCIEFENIPSVISQ